MPTLTAALWTAGLWTAGLYGLLASMVCWPLWSAGLYGLLACMVCWPVWSAGLSKIAITGSKAPTKRQAGSYDHKRCSEIYEDLFNHNDIILVWLLWFSRREPA
jgi:hypothetical protein